jgi:hypothetical protein
MDKAEMGVLDPDDQIELWDCSIQRWSFFLSSLLLRSVLVFLVSASSKRSRLSCLCFFEAQRASTTRCASKKQREERKKDDEAEKRLLLITRGPSIHIVVADAIFMRVAQNSRCFGSSVARRVLERLEDDARLICLMRCCGRGRLTSAMVFDGSRHFGRHCCACCHCNDQFDSRCMSLLSVSERVTVNCFVAVLIASMSSHRSAAIPIVNSRLGVVLPLSCPFNYHRNRFDWIRLIVSLIEIEKMDEFWARLVVTKLAGDRYILCG